MRSAFILLAAATVLVCATAESHADDIVPELSSNVPEDSLVSSNKWWQVPTTMQDKPEAKATKVPAATEQWWDVPSTEIEVSDEESAEDKKKAKRRLHKVEKSAHNLLKNIIKEADVKKPSVNKHELHK